MVVRVFRCARAPLGPLPTLLEPIFLTPFPSLHTTRPLEPFVAAFTYVRCTCNIHMHIIADAISPNLPRSLPSHACTWTCNPPNSPHNLNLRHPSQLAAHSQLTRPLPTYRAAGVVGDTLEPSVQSGPSCARPCDRGFFCPSGTADPLACKVRSTPSSRPCNALLLPSVPHGQLFV